MDHDFFLRAVIQQRHLEIQHRARVYQHIDCPSGRQPVIRPFLAGLGKIIIRFGVEVYKLGGEPRLTQQKANGIG